MGVITPVSAFWTLEDVKAHVQNLLDRENQVFALITPSFNPEGRALATASFPLT